MVRMEEEGSRKFEIPPLPSRFGNIPDIWEKSKDDFSDDEVAGKTAIRLVPLSNEEICEMGEKVMRSVQSGVSRKSTATLFLLAYQLKSPGVGNTKRVFPKADPKENIFDLEISSFDDKVVGFPGGPITVKRGSNSAENAKAYAYLAASFLRLFAKSPEIFCDAWSRIVRGYKTFYSSECPL